MEDFEELKPDLLSEDQLELDEDSGYHFMEAGVWAKAIAIIACAFVVLILLIIFGILSNDGFGGSGAFGGGVFLMVLMILGLLILFVSYLFRFNRGMQDGISQQDPESFESGINSLKNYFIFIGVFTILTAVYSIIKSLN